MERVALEYLWKYRSISAAKGRQLPLRSLVSPQELETFMTPELIKKLVGSMYGVYA